MSSDPADVSVYAPPSARVADIPVLQAQRFYAVSSRKLLILLVATLGLYQIYWMYEHWAHVRAATGRKLWPVMRGLFAIFFTHSLAKEIHGTLQANAGRDWAYATVVTVLISATALSSILGRLASKSVGSPYTDIVSLLLLIPIAWGMLGMQNAANAALGDERGESNSRLTGANWAWIAIGVALWALSLIGMTLEA